MNQSRFHQINQSCTYIRGLHIRELQEIRFGGTYINIQKMIEEAETLIA